jgi:twitching motility protein PilT
MSTPEKLPSIYADSLLQALLTGEVVSERELISVFGERRHMVSLNDLEMELVRADFVSNAALLAARAAVSGRPVLDQTDPAIRADLLPRRTAKLAGALAVSNPDRPTVAFVEDTEENVKLVSDAIGRTDFAIVLMTAPQFQSLFSTYYPESGVETRPEAQSIWEIFDEAVTREASDIHLGAGIPPMLRIDGKLVQMHRAPLSIGWLNGQFDVLLEERFEAWKSKHDVDLAITYGSARFRINAGQDLSGPLLAARRLPVNIPSLDELSIPAAVRRMANLDRGLVLVTGPTGSGKSTTLAALLQTVASGHGREGRHLITLEDPVEYLLVPGPTAIVRQRQLGRDFETFSGALRQALRQDPDVIFVGELRDLETARVAIQAAETGHLVFSTIHTYDASSTIDRLVGQFPEGEQEQVRSQLAYVLKGVVSQTLLPRLDRRGRVAAFEILIGTPAVANNLRRPAGATAVRQMIETGAKEGMVAMDASLADLVRSGAVSRTEAEMRARDLEDFNRRLGTHRGDG